VRTRESHSPITPVTRKTIDAAPIWVPRTPEQAVPAAVAAARAAGLDVVGPIPADSVFHQGIQGRFDGVLSLYHDQGHIASKTSTSTARCR
jgi:hypothetical protein